MAIQNTDRDNFVNSEKIREKAVDFFVPIFWRAFVSEKLEIFIVENIRENEMVWLESYIFDGKSLKVGKFNV